MGERADQTAVMVHWLLVLLLGVHILTVEPTAPLPTRTQPVIGPPPPSVGMGPG
jgi:hypothetical protein